MPQAVEDCVSALLADWKKDPSKRPEHEEGQEQESQAFAICQAAQNKSLLDFAGVRLSKGRRRRLHYRKAITDVPNLRGAAEHACGNCAYYKMLNSDGPLVGICSLYEFESHDDWLCDSWERMEPEQMEPMPVVVVKEDVAAEDAKAISLTADTLVTFGEPLKTIELSETMARVGAYGIRFTDGSEKDLSGEWFASDTDYGARHGDGAVMMFHHGIAEHPSWKAFTEHTYAAVKTRRDDSIGIFVETVLNLADEYEKVIYDLVKAGKLRWSSGTAAHMMRKDTKSGKILRWHPIEFSMSPIVIEPRLPVIVPLKSLTARSTPNAEGKPEAGVMTPAGSEAQGQANAELGTNEELENMGDEIKTVIDGIGTLTNSVNTLAENVKTITTRLEKAELALKQEPAPTLGTSFTITKDPADVPFKSLGANLMAVKTYALTNGRTLHPRLKYLETLDLDSVKATGASEAIGAEGGFLLEPTLAAEVLKPMHEEGPFTSAVARLPVGTNSNSGTINGVDETSRATGSRWGGVQGYRLAEGGTKTSSKPAFRQINWKLKKYAVLMYATDELLADAAQLAAIFRQSAGEELMFMANDDILNGAGVGGPLGVLVSGAYVSVAKETNQLAASIVHQNISNMWKRVHSRSKANAVWYINTDINSQLDDLALAVGTGAVEQRVVTYGPEGVMRIKGKPVVETEFNATLGTIGDIIVADMSQYLFWEKGDIQEATSIHVQFTTDETAFRFVYRCDGQPAIAAPLTPYKGTATLSPFVALATRV